MTHDIVVVGAGRRAQEAVFPALLALGDRVRLAGVHTRTRRELSLFRGRLEVTTRPLDELDVAGADAVIVVVPPRAVPDVLARLGAFDTSRAVLLLDTPVLLPGDLGAVRHFRRFRRVLASEDCYALPPIVLARRLVDEGRIGRLRHVHMFHSGYRHHALAALHRLTGHRPSRVSAHRWNRSAAEVRARFPGRVGATIVEPRVYDAGRLLVSGERASIADYPLAGKDVVEIGYVDGPDGGWNALTVDGEPVAPTELDRAFAECLPTPLVEDTRMQRLKIRGLMDVIVDSIGDGPAQYDPFDAVADHLSLRVAERARVVLDPRVGPATLTRTGLRAAGRVLATARRR